MFVRVLYMMKIVPLLKELNESTIGNGLSRYDIKWRDQLRALEQSQWASGLHGFLEASR